MIAAAAARIVAAAAAGVVAAVAAGVVVPVAGAFAACTSFPTTADPDVLRTVYRVGLNLAVPDKVMLAGFEAGWVESHMNNLPCGDADSLGVFQQRPSQGWGTPEQIMTVSYAANAFFTRAVVVAAQYPGYTAGQVAQAVQRSAFPQRYDQAQTVALGLISQARNLLALRRDFTSDGRADLVARRGDSGQLYLYRGAAGGLAGTPSPLGNWGVFDVITPVSDFDEDGHADLLARRRDSGNLYLYRGTGSATFHPGTLVGDWGGFNAITGVADWDGDGNVDVMARSRASGWLYLYRGNGGAGFYYPGRVLSTSDWNVFSHVVGAGDVDRDGNPDLLARRGDSGNLYLYRGGDSGGLLPALPLGGWSGFNRVVGGGDWDQDGRLDVVSRSAASGILYLYRGTGNGGLVFPAQVLHASDWSVFDIIS